MANNMIKTDICIIGAGAGGLSVAAGAVQMGAKVVLVEKGKMGGDCLNYGCVPSKSLLAAGKFAQEMRQCELFGIDANPPQIDFSKVMTRVHAVMQTIGAHDSVKRFRSLGVDVIQEKASFIDDNTIIAGETKIRANRFVIATGSSPAVLPIPGLDQVPYYTNETIFDLNHRPEHLIVIGGGPIGCELSQAFVLLGIKVTLIESQTILPRAEKDIVADLRDHLTKQGLTIHEQSRITRIGKQGSHIVVSFEQDGTTHKIIGTDMLVATGRKPNVYDLNLIDAGVAYSNKGIKVNEYMQTTNRIIYALGDVTGGYLFTHMANYQAGIVLRNILFKMYAKADYSVVPWVTYTDPELAHVGLSTEQLSGHPDFHVLTSDFAANDRAQIERSTLGKIKVITDKNGIVLGATILGAHAGDLILPWVMAVRDKKSIRSMAELIVPYPTLSEISKRVAGEYYAPRLFSSKIRKLVRFLQFLR